MKRAVFVAAIFLAEPLRLVYFSRMGLSTDWLLALAVLAALVTRPPRGALLGFVLGAGRDLMLGQPIGFEAMMFCALAWMVGITGRTVYREAFTTQFMMILGASLVHASAVFVQRVGSLEGVPVYLVRTAGPGALIPALIVPLGFQILRLAMRPRFSEDIEALLKETRAGQAKGKRR